MVISPGAASATHFAAGIAGHCAELRRRVASQRDIALHVQVLVERHEFEQVPGTGRHAVGAGAAFLGIHLRQPVGIHVNGVEGAGALAIRQAEATPGAALAAARYDRRCPTAFEAAIFGDLVCLQAAATAAQPCDQFLGRPASTSRYSAICSMSSSC